jgi:hypothetical protein
VRHPIAWQPTHSEEAPQVFAAAFRVVESMFGRRGICGHAFALGVGQGMRLHAIQGERVGATVR